MKKLTFISIIYFTLMSGRVFSQAIGIGASVFTPDPSAMLEVQATNKGILISRVALTERTSQSPITSPATSLMLYNTATVNDVTPGYYYWDGTKWMRLVGGKGDITCNTANFVLKSNGTDVTCSQIFDNGTNVGIGTAYPQARLHVENGEFWLFNNGNNTRFVIGDNPTTGQYGWLQWDSNLDLFRIDHSSTPGDGLKLNGNFVSIGNLPVDEPLKVGLDTIEFMRVDTTGNVGIGTTTPGYKLQVGNSGDGSSAVANAWNTFSDIRLKENIKEITPKEALQDVLNLRGVRFNWKNDSTKKVNIGLIAQEVEKIIPEVVNTDSDGYKSVSYSNLVSVLIQAIKEQQKIIEKLQVENTQIKQENTQIKQENTQIKAENAQIKSEVKALAEQVNNLINILSAENKVGNK